MKHVAVAFAALVGLGGFSAGAAESLDHALPPPGFSLQPESPDKDTPPLPVETETPFFKAWSGSVLFGLNGSDGNSENLSVRAGFNAERKTDAMHTKFWANYTYATDDGNKSESKGELGGRNDWFIKDTPWLVFVDGLIEYDEFQSWNWRLSAHGGIGYAFIRNDETTLIGRVGAGFNQTLGGPDEEFTPEGLLGVDFSHQITERQKIYANVDYYPSFRSFPDYRLWARAGWEIIIDPEASLTLKVGVEDKYNSNPGENIKKNDIDYFVLLGWSF